MTRVRAGLGRWTSVLVFAGYVAISCAYEGWRLLPHPGRQVIGFGRDPEIFIWSFAWWPHAIGHLTNPFFTHALYAPSGINLTWTPASAGLALLFSPFTILFGPVVSYNVSMLVLPALAAWTAFLLCRHVTHSIWASVVGGYLFGFSSPLLAQQISGHQHQLGVFLIPLIALVLVRYVQGELTRPGLAWRLGVLLACQLWISTELALTVTIVMALALALALWLVPDARPRLRSSLLPIVGGYALGGLFAAPFVVYALLGFHSGELVNGRGPGADLLNFAVPTEVIGIGGESLTAVSGNFPSSTLSAYLGLPTLLIVALFGFRARRDPAARFLVAALGAVVLIVLGTALRVDGHRVIALPWAAVSHIPFVKNALAFRFAVYVALAAGVIVALWTATTRGRIFARPYVLPALAVLALVPAVWRTSYPSFQPQSPERLAFFTEGLYKTCLQRDEIVATFPFGASDSYLWQAESGFRFRLAASGLAPQPKYAEPLTSFERDPIVRDLVHEVDTARPTMDTLLAFAANHHVDRILSVASSGYPSQAQMRAFGSVQLVGGVLVAPACGSPSLQTRDLSGYVARYGELAGSNIGYCSGTSFNLIPATLRPAGGLAGAKPANFVVGRGLSCLPPPASYKRRGYATPEMSVPANTYPLYAP